MKKQLQLKKLLVKLGENKRCRTEQKRTSKNYTLCGGYMIVRAIKLLHREFNSINEAALLLGVFTLGSSLLGLVRDRLFAGTIGAGQALDIYYTAFRIPDFIFAVLGPVVSVAILMPYFVNALNAGGKESARKFMSNMFSLFFLVIMLFCIVAYFLFPQLAPLIAPGFDQVALDEVVQLGRIILLSPFLLGISNLFGTITQAYKKFVVFGLSPLLYNGGIILGTLFLYPLLGTVGLAYGVVLGALLHMLIQLPVVIREGVLPRLTFSIEWEYVREVVRVAIPRTLTLALSTVTLLVLGALATTVSTGSVAIFNLSKNLQSVPLAIIGVSFSVAAFPTLVHYFSQDNKAEFVRHILAPARQIIFWSFPVIALFVVLRAQIVRVILGTGEFTWSDTRLVAAALALFALSVVAQSLILLFVRGYYAAGKTWRPFTVNLLAAGATIALSFLFLRIYHTFPSVQHFFEHSLRVPDVPGTSVLVLPLAYSIGAILNAIVLYILFRREFIHGKSGLHVTFWQSFAASFMIGFVAYVGLEIFDEIFAIQTTFGLFLQGFAAGIIGISAGLLILKALGNEELDGIIETFRHKILKRRVTFYEREEL